MNNPNEVCCPEFNPELWDGKVFEWQNKKFALGHVWTFLYIPFGFGGLMKKINDAAQKNNVDLSEGITLSETLSPWKMCVLVAASHDVPGFETATLSGKFIAKTYEGDFKNIKKWMEDFDQFTHRQNLRTEKTYAWYTTCPKCAKKYGKNYVVIIGKIG